LEEVGRKYTFTVTRQEESNEVSNIKGTKRDPFVISYELLHCILGFKGNNKNKHM